MRPTRTRAALLALALAGAACGGPSGPRPNVLVLSLDSVARSHVSAYGWRPPLAPAERTTPVFERLAAEGVLFEQAVSSTSWTLPAHMALLTGMPDPAHGVTDNHKRLAPGIVTMAEWLSDAGYATAGFVSGPNLSPVFGFGQGFDRYVNCGVETPLGRFEVEEVGAFRDVHAASHATVSSGALLEASDAWIAECADRDAPFFAFVHWWDPHYDYLPPAGYLERFDADYTGRLRGVHATESKTAWSERDRQHLQALYDAELRATDDAIAALLDRLEERGLLDDTIVVLLADHGEEFYEHGRWGHQRTLFDEVVRIPLAMRWPAAIPAGVRPHGQARIQDVLATLAELLDRPAPDTALSESLAPLWRDPAAEGAPQLLQLHVPFREIDAVGLRTPDAKVVWDRGLRSGSVYDLRADPAELAPRSFQRLQDEADPAARRLAEELERVDRHRARLPSALSTHDLPAGLQRELQQLGYLDGDDDEDPR